MRVLLLACSFLAISTSVAVAADAAAPDVGSPTSGLSWITLIGVMTVAGVAGGTVNYIQIAEDEENGWKEWAKRVLAGTAASFLMPLFLNTISSKLVAEILGGTAKSEAIFVFSGFCLLAGISSRAFIQSLSDRILREAEEAKRQAQEARDEVTNVEVAVAPFVEPDSEDETEEARREGLQLEQPTDADRQFLRTIDHARFTLRSISGIARQAGRISHDETRGYLDALIEKGLVR
ncbi:MAG: hypothetical protein HON53_10725, partial [Planctomycetaceae bacterium]|nr:hypothetical protein [Planctomycetaceae bacterium]